MKRIRFTALILAAAILLGINTLIPPQKAAAESADYIVLVGGTYSVDDGCPSWGTTDYSQIRAIGDTVGTVVIKYEDGSESEIPLIFGYTMWFRSLWNEQGLPFKGEGADEELSELLRATLCLYGGYEGLDSYFLKIKPENKPIISVNIVDSKDKEGKPVFSDIIYVTGSQTVSKNGVSAASDDIFFQTHTVDAADPYPEDIQKALIRLRNAVSTGFGEYKNVEPYEFPKGAKQTVVFSGNSLANIATGVYYENLMNLTERFDSDGMLHTSYKDAPSWWYNGFGAYTDNVGSYYDSFYSRDGGRAIMTMNTLGDISKALKSVEYGGKCMMYFPENGLTLGGEQIPGHYTVIINKPMIYSTYLVPEANWATKYTEKEFGSEYQNLGNQETDGHGLMMLATYNVWKNSGENKAWAEANWDYISEGVKWIEWCLDHEELSFVRKGLLYAESEAGMCAYTLYCNVPCYLGILCYAEIAESVGKTDVAEQWRKTASSLKSSIENGFLYTNNGITKWRQNNYGFYFCPVVDMLSDYYGYDTEDMDKTWVDAASVSYDDDIKSVAQNGYFGATGIGYSHSEITQAALLLDRTSDASILVGNLCRISYAPGQVEPYLIPEGITVDLENKTLRRQGDLGNLVQLAEGLKCLAITIGVNPVKDGSLKIMPRLPENWNVTLNDYSVSDSGGAAVSMYTEYPCEGTQKTVISLKNASGITDNVKFRFGPFEQSTTVAAAQINGKYAECELNYSGDSAWVWVTVPAEEVQSSIAQIAVITAQTSEQLGDFPAFDDIPLNFASEESSNMNLLPVIIIFMIIIVAAAAVIIIIKIKKNKEK